MIRAWFRRGRRRDSQEGRNAAVQAVVEHSVEAAAVTNRVVGQAEETSGRLNKLVTDGYLDVLRVRADELAGIADRVRDRVDDERR